jgi:hypothetical protein
VIQAFRMLGAESLLGRKYTSGRWLPSRIMAPCWWIVGSRMTLITSHQEFDLGPVGSDERIVRELSGTQVVRVTVVKASDLKANSESDI